jgi:AcrR family transcriptional regulator
MQIATSRATASVDHAAEPAEPTTGREAKRERTRLRVELAAVELALEFGSEHVTVDQICEASDISARTFFNYFGSRDAAIVGEGKVPPADLLEAFVAADGPLLGDFLAVFVASVRRREPNIDLIRARRALFEKEPHLAMQRMTREGDAREVFIDVVTRRLRRDDPSISDEEAHAEAVIAVAVGLGVVHAAGSRWIESGGIADMNPLINQAIERLRRLI